MGPRIPIHRDKDPVEGLDGVITLGPSSALITLWHAQAQRDHAMISGKELAVVERLAGQEAAKARTIYNPYTGEIRKVMLPDWVGKHRPEDPTVSGWTPKKG